MQGGGSSSTRLSTTSLDREKLFQLEQQSPHGLSAVGLPSSGLSAVGLASQGLSAVGLPSNGLSAVGLPSNGLSAVGLPSSGLSAVGLPSSGLLSSTQPNELSSKSPPQPKQAAAAFSPNQSASAPGITPAHLPCAPLPRISPLLENSIWAVLTSPDWNRTLQEPAFLQTMVSRVQEVLRKGLVDEPHKTLVFPVSPALLATAGIVEATTSTPGRTVAVLDSSSGGGGGGGTTSSVPYTNNPVPYNETTLLHAVLLHPRLTLWQKRNYVRYLVRAEMQRRLGSVGLAELRRERTAAASGEAGTKNGQENAYLHLGLEAFCWGFGGEVPGAELPREERVGTFFQKG